MNIERLEFTSSQVNSGVDEIIERLRTMTDLHGETVFQSVERGLDIPNKTIHDSATPAIRIWQDSDKAELRASQFFIGEQVSQLSIYFYLYAPPINGVYPDIQQKRQELVKYTLRYLEYPDTANPTGFEPDENWWFYSPQDITIDHTAAFRRLSSNIDVLPPWYVTRVDVLIKTHNYP